MAYDKSFTQRDYNKIVDSLDTALDVFRKDTTSDAKAEAALRDFVENHYFKVWRAMA